ncbi:hypothetical protein [Brucella rhizosphaerae]|uniref:Tail terminator n=1 Tax=Brucella rhizosphaerae TaxID=571254 RepID=A0A256FPE9_9HYPH|nr:hypothetical protein [Brucella rhizosphaerae]OYR16719.1 hypothetical protein CEV32_4353 [Brucella rhizosphaerae]
MATPQTFEPIEDFLRSQWTVTPLVFENEDFELANHPEAVVLVEVFGDLMDQASIGAETQSANRWRETGQLSLHVLIPRGVGTRPARQISRQLYDLFRGQEIGAIRFGTASIGAGEPGEMDGNYYRMTVTIDVERDEG